MKKNMKYYYIEAFNSNDGSGNMLAIHYNPGKVKDGILLRFIDSTGKKNGTICLDEVNVVMLHNLLEKCLE